MNYKADKEKHMFLEDKTEWKDAVHTGSRWRRSCPNKPLLMQRETRRQARQGLLWSNSVEAGERDGIVTIITAVSPPAAGI